MTIEPRTVTAFIGPSGCGKSTFLRTLNRMHEVIPGARRQGRGAHRRRRPVRARASTRCWCAARSAWCSSGRTRSPRCRSARTCSPASSSTTSGSRSRTRTTLVEKSLQGANLWNEVKDRLDKPGAGLSGGQQQRLCIARAIAVVARGAADGRALLGPRPDLDLRDRGPHRGAQAGVHDRDRDPQHAAGVARLATRRRSSTSPAPASRASSSSTTTPRRSSRRPPCRRPRTTSPAGSGSPQSRGLSRYWLRDAVNSASMRSPASSIAMIGAARRTLETSHAASASASESARDRLVGRLESALFEMLEEADLGGAVQDAAGRRRRDEAVAEAQDDGRGRSLEHDAVGRDEDRVIGAAALRLADRRHVHGVRQRLRPEQQPGRARGRAAVDAAVESDDADAVGARRREVRRRRRGDPRRRAPGRARRRG